MNDSLGSGIYFWNVSELLHQEYHIVCKWGNDV